MRGFTAQRQCSGELQSKSKKMSKTNKNGLNLLTGGYFLLQLQIIVSHVGERIKKCSKSIRETINNKTIFFIIN